MSDRRDGMDPPDTEVDREEPSGDEAASPLERLPGRRVLHVTLLLILAVPAWVWLTRPSSPGDPAVPGGVEVDEAAVSAQMLAEGEAGARRIGPG